MNPNERFARAVAALPTSCKERLDRDAPLDWAALEDSGLGVDRGDAPHAYTRLPEAVEALAQRLIRDVGLVPADVVAGTAREERASAWVQRAGIEPEGEGYRIRDNRGGEVYTNVRPEAVAGYATLALELAAAVHEAGQRWIEAGERFRGASGSEPGDLARCAIAMCDRLRSLSETVPGRAPTISVADALELAWNGQDFETRAALSAMRPKAEHGACAPRENPYTPVAGHRLHAYRLEEIRWLRALAAEAAAGESKAERDGAPPQRTAETESTPPSAITEEAALADINILAARIQAASEETDVLELGSNAGGLVLEKEVEALAETAKGLPSSIRRRMGYTYGIRLSQNLALLEGSESADLIGPGTGASIAGGAVPKWLEELALSLLADTGVQTRDGVRTAAIRLDPREEAEGYTVTNTETGARGHLTIAALVEQVRLGIAFVHEVWTGVTMLRKAGHESDWTLKESEAQGRTFTDTERATLAAAGHIARALDRQQHAHARVHGDREPSAVKQARMAADALSGIDPSIRATAGWPGSVPPPNPSKPADIARVARFAETLRGEIRSIANHLVVAGITGGLADEDASGATPRGAQATPRAMPGAGGP